MIEGDVLQDDDGMLRWILLEKSFEVGAAGGQDHFVSFTCLSVTGQCHLKEQCAILLVRFIGSPA